MRLAERYPEISIEIFLGLVAATLILVAIVFVGRRVPHTKVPTAFVFGLALGVALDGLAGKIRQRSLDDRVLETAGRGDAATLRKALDAGGSPMADESTSGGIVALSYALNSGDLRSVELLLQRGADPQYGSWIEGSSLEIAAKRHRPDLAALLRRYGAR